jgi:hypothetical protein
MNEGPPVMRPLAFLRWELGLLGSAAAATARATTTTTATTTATATATATAASGRGTEGEVSGLHGFVGLDGDRCLEIGLGHEGTRGHGTTATARSAATCCRATGGGSRGAFGELDGAEADFADRDVVEGVFALVIGGCGSEGSTAEAAAAACAATATGAASATASSCATGTAATPTATGTSAAGATAAATATAAHGHGGNGHALGGALVFIDDLAAHFTGSGCGGSCGSRSGRPGGRRHTDCRSERDRHD